MIDKVEIGLDQELSMPEDSFVIDYFKALTKVKVGAPVYFVVTRAEDGAPDYSDVETQVCCFLCLNGPFDFYMRFPHFNEKETISRY